MDSKHEIAPGQRLLNTFEAARYLAEEHGVDRTPKTLATLRYRSEDGPAFHKIGPRMVGYFPEELDRWARSIISAPIRTTAEAV